MATSGSVDFSITRNEIIRQALLLCNGIEENETVPYKQAQDAGLLLNAFVKLVTKRQPLFGTVDVTIPLYDKKQAYTIGPGGNKDINRPVNVTQARRLIRSSTVETPIIKISRQEYMELPLKDSESPVNQFYYDPQLTQGVLYVWGVSNVLSTSLTDGVTDLWTDSGTTPGEYYHNPLSASDPYYVFAAESELTEGTLGSLADGEWAYGDQDTLGTDTIYVKLPVGDPDTQAAGYVKYLPSDPDKIIITTHRTLADFDDPDDTPDFPQEAYLMLIYQLAALLGPQYAPSRVPYLEQKAALYMREYLANDSELASYYISPFNRSNQ